MKRDRNWVIAWLCAGALMVASMVMIGGITRLTHSGLSMTDWKLIIGAVPPLNHDQWMDAFGQYQQSPEYQKINADFTLAEFKSIFFWEYLHRLIGRLIGIVFLVPFVILLIRKSLDRKLMVRCLILFGLGALQGFLGWFMVKSGLVNRPSVSHFRLAIHLSAAFLTFSYILWLVLTILKPERGSAVGGRLPLMIRLLTAAVSVQIVLGAFVAGLKAGWIYPTFPKMGDQWMPDKVGAIIRSGGTGSLFSDVVSVQFIHRTFAYAVVVMVLLILNDARKRSLNRIQQNIMHLLLSLVLLQFTLGVLTLLFHVPISLAIAHQLGALMLLSCSVVLIYVFPCPSRNKKASVKM